MDDVIRAVISSGCSTIDVAAILRQCGSHAAWAWRVGIPVAGSGHSGLLLAVRAYHGAGNSPGGNIGAESASATGLFGYVYEGPS